MLKLASELWLHLVFLYLSRPRIKNSSASDFILILVSTTVLLGNTPVTNLKYDSLEMTLFTHPEKTLLWSYKIREGEKGKERNKWVKELELISSVTTL